MSKCVRMLLTLIMLIIYFMPSAYAQEQPQITVVTEELYPFNYWDGEKVAGKSTDKIMKTLNELGWQNYKIKLLPWARAYNTALNEPNVLIYSMLRIKNRETLFKWVGKVGQMRLGAVKLKSRDDIKIDSIGELKNYRLAVFVESPLVAYLEDKGVGVSDMVGRYPSVVPMLIQGRVDMVPGSIVGFLAEARKQGYEDIFEVAYYFDDLSKDLYCAFSDETDDEIVNQFKEAFLKVNP